MNKPRKLQQNVWYKVGTALNIGEPLFQFPWAETLFYRVLREANARFGFEMRGLKLENECLSFYIKPVNGLDLPKIMQWMKQTFSVRL
ncbi:MAG: hypothetical protein LBG27_10425, partial [Spirochaetaceae bacterium]|nr:hypothetical protein [Spirochaetaceae bacterium]